MPKNPEMSIFSYTELYLNFKYESFFIIAITDPRQLKGQSGLRYRLLG